MVSDLMTMGFDPNIIQARIRKGLVMQFELAQAIEKLPDCDSRIELEAKFMDVTMRLAELRNQISDYDPHMCWYGFMPTCPNCVCDECPGVVKQAEMNHIPTVEEFDSTRIERARAYYKEQQNADDLPF